MQRIALWSRSDQARHVCRRLQSLKCGQNKFERAIIVGSRFDRQTWQGYRTRALGEHDKFLESEVNHSSGKFRWRLTIIHLQMDYGGFWVLLRNAVKWRVYRNMCRVDRVLVWIGGLVGPVIETLAYIPIIHKRNTNAHIQDLIP
jgi:hypothetical protein